ncbi:MULTISPECIES: DUF4892 domain-containing protein [unclassified Pseudomonas]|uniref:DUF4892 domain-containing protein n=1 Tax=unclassified Pseudomonas TaxID=196821 RepID=UPI000BC74FCF|nr:MULTISPECIES: DUF4892 domain-containing protein [unclassified Pseudomonas]PVZ13564.1 uncharacterized protein DUF4892 [Pseudomonas sp. URIL14HWK12:I12]PVZ23870.1 uncharacterized protein DUF4892 [Pseudomonas sp. URIL14HWK12:I10]PVZ33491.1 uncharacterized protein DUF4892 [Pseudomonas sp. URIL14HWK12:I11]SNZ11780.1 protein of unknown function [Pseudomonas sp. URIL14HWK12:I9]
MPVVIPAHRATRVVKPLACWFALALGLSTVGAQGAELADWLPGPDARVVDQRSLQQQERFYPLGPLRKISGQLRMEGRLDVRGKVESLTQEYPTERTMSTLFDSAREALREPGSQVVFWCQGRDCGESSLWANEVFGNARLFGADEQQAFLLQRQDARTLVALYGVTRGNRRVALHVERLVAEQPLGVLLPTPSTLLRELRSSGRLAFADLADMPQPEWVAVIARGLNLDSTLRVRVCGPHAAAWQQALYSQGVRQGRLSLCEQGQALSLEWLR